MLPRVLVIACLLGLVAAGAAEADLHLRGNLGWMDQNIYDIDKVGSPYLSGPGGSLEIGIDLSDRLVLFLEQAPSYTLPARAIPEAGSLEDGRYRWTGANLLVRMEPIDSIEPYLTAGFGRAVFTFDYGDSGQVFTIGGVQRRLAEEEMRGWIVALGIGFEKQIASWLWWGSRGRYLYNRWEASSNFGRFFPYSSGDGLMIEASFDLRFF